MDLSEELSITNMLPDQVDSDLDWERPDDRFIPVRAADLCDLLVSDADEFGIETEEIKQVLAQIRSQIENEALSLRHEIETEYAPLDPDRDTRSLVPLESLRTDDRYERVFERLNHLLDKANFEKLTEVQIEQAIRQAKSRRINVRVQSEKIEHLEVWVRGQGLVKRRKLTWRHPFAGVEQERSIFKRMAVVARLRGDPHIIVKLFKDIPEADVEALLPHARATMTWLDRIQLFGSGAGAIGATVLKILTIAISFAALGKLLWIVMIGMMTLSARTFFGYRRVRKTRSGQRVRHLYFQNLSNNASAIQLVVSMVKQEELKEAYLGFVFAHRLTGNSLGNDPIKPAVLCQAIEEYLSEKIGASVDFDIDDAVETLIRLRFVDDEQDVRIRRPAKPFTLADRTMRTETRNLRQDLS